MHTYYVVRLNGVADSFIRPYMRRVYLPVPSRPLYIVVGRSYNYNGDRIRGGQSNLTWWGIYVHEPGMMR